jgi:post-segregation antitoxin (ccd killing protein)
MKSNSRGKTQIIFECDTDFKEDTVKRAKEKGLKVSQYIRVLIQKDLNDDNRIN